MSKRVAELNYSCTHAHPRHQMGLAVSLTQRSLYQLDKSPPSNSHYIGGFVGFTACLEILKKKKKRKKKEKKKRKKKNKKKRKNKMEKKKEEEEKENERRRK